MLVDFLDSELVDYLVFGWLLEYTSTRVPSPTFSHHTPAVDLESHIVALIQKELSMVNHRTDQTQEELTLKEGNHKSHFPPRPWC